jgi:hypothetical protein
MFVMTHEEIQHVLQTGKKSVMPTQWLTIARKRRTQIGFKTPLEEI